MLWKERADVRFKSCSNTHIDVVVREGVSTQSWKAMGFYGHPDVSMRFISWRLIESLKR